MNLPPPATSPPASAASAWRAWFFLIRHSWQRQARARLMVWIALGLLAFLTIWVALITERGVWDVRNWRQPRRGGPKFSEWVFYTQMSTTSVVRTQPPEPHKEVPNQRLQWLAIHQQNGPAPWTLTMEPEELAVRTAVAGAFDAALESKRPRPPGLTYAQWLFFARLATPNLLKQAPAPRRTERDLWAALAIYHYGGPAPPVFNSDPVPLAVAAAYDAVLQSKERAGELTYAEWVFYVRTAPPSVLRSLPSPVETAKAPADTARAPADTAKLPLFDPSKTPPRPRDLLVEVHRRGGKPPLLLTLDPMQTALASAYAGAFDAVLQQEDLRLRIAFVSFTQIIVFSIFTTFLLPLCSLSFATEALGREREQGNLLWTLTRPLPRASIYLAKFIAVLPWCLALNVGGFYLVCQVAGPPGQMAFATFWQAIILGTLAFTALFHLMGALFRRAPVIAILYAFFLETVMGNLPGHLKRASISFYVRCLMYDSAGAFNLRPDRPLIFSPVSGTVAFGVLVGLTVVLLAAGAGIFSRSEYLDIS